jgi:hypothetical protein
MFRGAVLLLNIVQENYFDKSCTFFEDTLPQKISVIKIK